MPKSRRKASKGVISKTGILITENYCRKCMQTKPARDFYDCVDRGYIDANGLFASMCRSCLGEMYNNIYSAEHSMEKTLLKMCRMLNLKYSEEAIAATKNHLSTLEQKGKELPNPFGIYKSKLISTQPGAIDNRLELDLTYQDVTQITISKNNPLADEEFEEARDLKLFWGTDDKEDIEFLENELANFKQTHRADTYAEVVLLREVCFKLLDIHKSRQKEASTDSSLKQLMEVMKNLAISPNQANAASAGKGADCFGVWLAEISQIRPEEWYEDKSVYKDVDNIEDYNERIFISSMRAFTTGNREFTIEGGEIIDDDMDGE